MSRSRARPRTPLGMVPCGGSIIPSAPSQSALSHAFPRSMADPTRRIQSARQQVRPDHLRLRLAAEIGLAVCMCFPANGAPTAPAAVCQNGVMDYVLHPLEPLAIRLTVAGQF